MCTVLLPPGVSPIAVNKYIDINIKMSRACGTYREEEKDIERFDGET
jgi:hypothetical protein